MESFMKICSTLDLWQDSEYASERKDFPSASLQWTPLGKTYLEISENFVAFIFQISSGRYYEKHAWI